MRRKILFCVLCVIALLAFTGCPTEVSSVGSDDNSVTVSDLEASGAETSITEDNMSTVMSSLLSDGGMSSIVPYFESLMEFDASDSDDSTEASLNVFSMARSISSDDLSTKFSELITDWNTFTEEVEYTDADEDGIIDAYDATFEYNEDLGDITELIDGLSVSIPTSEGYINLKQNEGATLGSIDANADISVSSSIDMNTFLDNYNAEFSDETVTTVIKNIKSYISFKSSVNGTDFDMESPEDDDYEDDDAYEDAYDEYLETSLKEVAISFSIDTSNGMVITVPVTNEDLTETTVGGKVIASFSVSFDGTAYQLYSLEDAFDSYIDGDITSDGFEEVLNDSPLSVDITVKAYDDDGNVTCTMMDVSSAFDLYSFLEPYMSGDYTDYDE